MGIVADVVLPLEEVAVVPLVVVEFAAVAAVATTNVFVVVEYN